MVELSEAQQTFRFLGIKKRPVLSINRRYSAPIVMQTDATEKDLLFQMEHDSDSFNRWEAAQSLGRAAITGLIHGTATTRQLDGFANALALTMRSTTLDNAFKALMLVFPPEAEIAASLGGDADSDTVVAVRESARQHVATIIKDELRAAFDSTAHTGAYQADTKGTSGRSLRYAALAMIAAGDAKLALDLAAAELAAPASMTAEIGALSAVLTIDDPQRTEMLDTFYQRHLHDHLLIDKWLMLNAQIPGVESYRRVETLLTHSAFSYNTPNRVYALIGGFSGGNLSGFNAAHGEGYRVVADTIIKLNSINPQVAARMSTGFRSWKIYNAVRRNHAKVQMERILAVEGLSRDVFDIISRTLEN
jgi:aminopeptidase N